MNATLRMNDALLIADRAFLPFQCIAWSPGNGTGDLSLSVIDRTSSRLLGRIALPGSNLMDAGQLSAALQKSREELIEQGYRLEPWQMPATAIGA
jgi:hypothetical protein